MRSLRSQARTPGFFGTSSLGFLAPNGIALLNKASWPSWARSGVTVLACLAIGLVTLLLSGALSAGNLVASFLMVLVAATIAYHKFWKRGATEIEQNYGLRDLEGEFEDNGLDDDAADEPPSK